MAALLSICSSSPLRPRNQFQSPHLLPLGNNYLFISDSLPSLTLQSNRNWGSLFAAKSTSGGVSVDINDPETEDTSTESVPETIITFPEVFPETLIVGGESSPEVDIPVQATEPPREEVFAVVMVGSRQYIVFPGRFIYTQRLKGANVNDKIKLNKVLLVGTKTTTYIGKPIVPNATVQAIVEEQSLDKKVIVFKYKKKKHYRRNIGHRQPITRIRITSITGYQDSPAVTLPLDCP